MHNLKALSLTDDFDALYEMFQEMPAEENGFMNTAFGLTKTEFAAFVQKRINESRGQDLSAGRVPATYYILYDENRNPVGLGKLRHYLNENLRKEGGHIGYGIRPSCRLRGWGSLLLASLLKEAAAKKIDKVLITIKEENTASRKVTENNGGCLTAVCGGTCYYEIDFN